MLYSSHKKFFSVKSKTIILVLIVYLLLSIIFFFIRYLDIKDFAKADQQLKLQRVQLVYKETLKRIGKFYVTRGFANINSYGIKQAFKEKNAKKLHLFSLPRWQVITKENPYLESFCFYDKQGKLLTYFGKKPPAVLLYADSKEKGYDGFWHGNQSFNYHAVSVAKDKQEQTIGYLVFIINPKYFLSEINKLTNIYAYIIYQKNMNTRLVWKLKDNSAMDEVIAHNKIQHLQNIIIKNTPYISYVIKGNGFGAKDDFSIIFLQNIAYWKTLLGKSIIQSLIILMLITVATSLLINYGFNIILKELDTSNKRLRESRNELRHLNDNLQVKIKNEIELKLKKEREANEKERILVHQSKMASMGEMIGNIAHQWRQPLTQLSSILINIKLSYDRDKLTREKFYKKIKESNEQILFMSKTIDDFRNFFASQKHKEKYKISSVLRSVKKLIGSSLKNNDITLNIVLKDDFEINGFSNEIAQAFLNILNNAKDILIERKIENASISIKAFTEDNKNTIIIEDNAGGVNVVPIEKIFEPYFSTKHAKSGTGIGLYMTKIIIEKNNHGTIKVSNTKHGALFIIIL